jgi:hypothetical protein
MLEELDFICDVVYLTSHMAKLRHFVTQVAKIPSIRIRFHPERIEARETALGMSMAVAEFLAFASGYDCRNMIVESRETSRTDNDVDSGWFCMAIHNTLEGWSHAATQMAASNVNSIHLCNTLFSSPMLLKWCLSFSGNPSLTSLSLSNSRPKGPSHYHRFFPHITLPSLESLTINGSISMDDLLPFLSRHPHVNKLQLKSTGFEEIFFPIKERARLSLESLDALTISSNFVEAFFNCFETPGLTHINLHLRSTLSRTLRTALSVLSSLDDLDSISLRITFNSHLSGCIPSELPVCPPMLLQLTNLHLEFRYPIYSPDTFVSFLALTQVCKESHSRIQTQLIGCFMFFPSVEKLRISWMSSGYEVDPFTSHWPVLIMNECPHMLHMVTPWGSWSDEDDDGIRFPPLS